MTTPTTPHEQWTEIETDGLREIMKRLRHAEDVTTRARRALAEAKEELAGISEWLDLRYPQLRPQREEN